MVSQMVQPAPSLENAAQSLQQRFKIYELNHSKKINIDRKANSVFGMLSNPKVDLKCSLDSDDHTPVPINLPMDKNESMNTSIMDP